MRLSLLLALALVGCPPADVALPADRAPIDAAGDALADDVPAADGADSFSLDADAFEADVGCSPTCHHDCLGVSAFCVAGEVWAGGHKPVPCCHFGEPWPLTGPVCGFTLLRTCASDCASAIDPRYSACIGVGLDTGAGATRPHITSMMCAEGVPRVVGAPCKVAADCRPAAADLALRCDSSTGRCVSTPRPPPPPGYGASCEPSTIDLPLMGTERLALVSSCSGRCYAALDATCLHAQCTDFCQLDEDCPDGSICVCLGSGYHSVRPQVCLPKSDRTLAGRVASVPCIAADAGADASADALGDAAVDGG